MNKIVVIGDIVASKKIADRSTVQKKLTRLFKEINSSNNYLDSPFTITLGDEFQALYKNADNIFKDIWKIIFVLYPVRVRFSIGVGKLSTGINRQQAIGMDGPAFHNAREGLTELKENASMFNISGIDLINTDLMKQILFLLSHTIEKWKITRIKIFNFLLEGLTIKQIAKKLKISDKAVYKNINTGGMNIVIRIFDEIAVSINSAVKKS